MQHLPAFTKQARPMDGALVGVFAAMASFGAVGWLSLQLPHPSGGLSDLQHVQHWLAMSFSTVIQTDAHEAYQLWLSRLSEQGVAWQITARLHACQAISLSAGFWAGWEVGQPRDSRIKKEGGRLVEGKNVYKYGKPSLFNKNKFGLELLPGFSLKKSQEREHFITAGGTGSGKTTATLHMMLLARERGDRVLIFDFKGITEKWPGKIYGDGYTSKSADTIILAAHDKRSAPWFIAKDINTKQSAKDFAARLIPESKEPVFSNGARQVLAGCICKLIKEKPHRWSFKDLSELVVLSPDEFKPIMRQHFPEAIRAVESAPVTVTGILLNLGAFAGLIHDLAELWPQAGGFSIIGWTKNPNHKIRTVILKTSTEFETLSAAMNSSLISAICSQITALPDVEPCVAPLWIWVDEFSTIGKINGWQTLLSTGRSKDLRAVMNMQSKSQLVETWGQHIAESWIDSVGIKLLGKQDGTGAAWASELVGKVTYSYPTYSSDAQSRRSTNWSAGQEEPLFSASQFQTQLGMGKFIVHGVGGVELKVQFPNTMDELPLLRQPDIPSLLCFAPHKLNSNNAESLPAPPHIDEPPATPSDSVIVSDKKTIEIKAHEIEQEVEETITNSDEFDIADFSEKKMALEAGKDLLKDKINEQLLLSAIESVAGADVAHAVEIGLQVAELTEAADQLPADQVLTRAERLKLRKKHKIELEQSL